MKATTIKIENPLLDELNHIKPKEKSLSAFVRETLEQTVRRQALIRAAEKYAHFLRANPKEKEWLEDWETSDLERPPKVLKNRD